MGSDNKYTKVEDIQQTEKLLYQTILQTKAVHSSISWLGGGCSGTSALATVANIKKIKRTKITELDANDSSFIVIQLTLL